MKPPGAEVRLGYWTDATVRPGDVIRTTTGRRYLVTRARRTRGRDPHWVTDCVVMAVTDPTPRTARIHRLHWHPRG